MTLLATTLLLATLPGMIYPGGKERAAARIINLIPPHKVYIEPFGGGLAVFRQKKPAERSILIDLDSQVVQKWRGFRMPGWGNAENAAGRPTVEMTGAAANAGNAGLRRRVTPELSLLDPNGRRADFYSGDAIDFLKAYPFDGSEVVYLDPPYPMETRSSGPLYRCEMTDQQHVELLRIAAALPCKVLISGYDCRMYREGLKGWTSESYTTMTRGGAWPEWLWYNFTPPRHGNGTVAELHDYSKLDLGGGHRERFRIKRKIARWKARLDRLPETERVILTAFAKADTRGREQLQRKIDRHRRALNRMNVLEKRALLAAIGDHAKSGVGAGSIANSGGEVLDNAVRS